MFGLPQSPAVVKRALWHYPWPLAALSASALFFPVTALPIAFLTLLGALSLGRLPEGAARRGRWLIVLSALASSVGLARFVVFEAMPGIVRGGRGAVERRAVSRLRDLLVVQDALRRGAWIDPDADGVGSAALITELCGGQPSRGQVPRDAPLLPCARLAETPLGPAVRHGAFLMTVCLPRVDGSWSADVAPAVDEERSERRFVAYAWPAPGARARRAFSIDEHDRILEAAFHPVLDAGPGPWVGGAPFDCRSALPGATRAAWRPWQGKRPREHLPGDADDRR